MNDSSDVLQYIVVRNEEEQFSIWRDNAPVPKGWHPLGQSGSKQECLDYIEKVWTDMRPLSVRKRIESIDSTNCASEQRVDRTSDESCSSLVDRLCEQTHSVRLRESLNSQKDFHWFVSRRIVPLVFTGWESAFEMLLQLDQETAESLLDANGASVETDIEFEGNVIIDEEKLNCLVQINVDAREGIAVLTRSKSSTDDN